MNDIDLKEIGKFIHDRLFKLRELSETFKKYYADTISLENLIYWLLQFGSIKDVTIAYKLLERVRFISEEQIIDLFKDCFSDLNFKSNKLIFCPIGHIIDSGSFLTYPLTKGLNLKEDQLTQIFLTAKDLSSKLEQNKEINTLIVYDDNIASGTQLNKFFSELLTESENEREHIDEPLPEKIRNRLIKMKIIYCSAIALGDIDPIEKSIKKKYNFHDFHIRKGSKLDTNLLSYSEGLWDNREECNEANELLKNIACSLYLDKDWDDVRKESRLLGYGNQSRLVAFSHNIPKTLLPVFWKYGIHNQRDWFPIFPERSEWTSYQKNILSLDPYLKHFANTLASGSFSQRNPVPSVTFSLSDGDSNSIAYSVSNQEIKDDILRYKVLKHQKLEEEQEESPQAGYGVPRVTHFQKDYDRYNREVKVYNNKIIEYEKAMKSAVDQIATVMILPIRIYNRGISPAHEVILNITLPDSVSYCDDLSDLLPKEPVIPSPPTSSILSSMHHIKPEVTLLSRISNKLSNSNEIKDKRIKSSYLDGNRIITIYFKKILHHTFRDYDLNYLFLNQPADSFSLKYQLICEEIESPIEGSLSVHLKEEKTISQNLYDAFTLNED